MPAGVVSAVADGTSQVVWTFDRPVTLLGPSKPDLQVREGAGGDWFGPFQVTQSAPAVIAVQYLATMEVGWPWQVLNGTQGLEPTTPILVPQSGLTIA